MKRLTIAATLSIVAGLKAGAASACECVPFPDDAAMVRAQIEWLADDDVGIDGVVISGDQGEGTVAIVRATRVWFGPRQSVYHVKKTSMCSYEFSTAFPKVRVVLKQLPGEVGWIARIKSFLWPTPPTYEAEGCQQFVLAMTFPAMRAAVQKRGRQTSR